MDARAGRQHLTDATVPPRIIPGLAVLLQAHNYAEELRRDLWDFAVEVMALRAEGLTNSHLRWLVCKGYLKHARELTVPGESGREFQHTGELTFSKRTCFVLTKFGVETAERVLRELGANDPLDVRSHSGNGQYSRLTAGDGFLAAQRILCGEENNASALRPRWDRDRHELRVGDSLVKQFKLPSPNQEAILTAFEEDGWPPRVDDPLPPEPDLDPKRRLHDTIKSLNRRQKKSLMRFMGDGTGEGICWKLTCADGDSDRPQAD